MVQLVSDYHPIFVEKIREIPGASWDKPARLWYFPEEMVDYISTIAKNLGYRVISTETNRLLLSANEDVLYPPRPNGIHDYQWAAVLKALNGPAHLFNDETGLGKGREVIEALKLRRISTVLVVAPAQARLVWQAELDKWWPDHPSVSVVRPTKKIELADITIVSYEMLPKVLIEASNTADPAVFDALIFDEIHYLQDPTSVRARACRELVSKYPAAWRAGMTATPITNKPDSICTPLNILFPGRFETNYKFAAHYMNEGFNDAGYRYFSGIRNEKELCARLACVSSRTTKEEVAHLLPAFITKLLKINPKSRIEEGVEWAQSQIKEGSQKVCLLTHLRDTAAELASARWPKQYEVFYITGEDTHEQRAAKLQAAKDAACSIVCATLHSVNVAIDMTFLTTVGFVEIYSRPADMIQVLGRFSRLSGKDNVVVTILASEENDDGAEQLAEKIDALNQVVKAGQGENALTTALRDLQTGSMSAGQFDEFLANIASNYSRGESSEKT
jgi:superfamily II DNA or RNA helicase